MSTMGSDGVEAKVNNHHVVHPVRLIPKPNQV